MHSVVETEENGFPTAVAVQTLWMKNNKLYWPPGKNVDRQTPSVPQANWLQFDCKLLKTSIETFEEALEFERMYSKHRDSNSFREEQERKQMKRLHPINFADKSDSDFIDVNDLVNKIKSATDTTESRTLNVSAGHSTQTSKYHDNCMVNKLVNPYSRTPKQSVAKTADFSSKLKTGTSKKPARKPLPFQKKSLRTSKVKSRSPVAVVTKAKFPRRYDNFLNSGNRFATDQVKTKRTVPTETIAKKQHLRKVRQISETDLDDGNETPAPGNYDHTSTPMETERNELCTSYITANNTEDGNTYVANSLNIADRTNKENEAFHFAELDNRVIQTNSTEVDILKKVNVLQSITIPPTTASQGGLSFEERLLKELGDLKKSQQSFETRMEKRIETFINDQTGMQLNYQPRLQSSYVSQSQLQNNYRQSRQYPRSQTQTRCREPVLPVHADFEEFEELDKKFPVDIPDNVEDLEFCIRKDLEFKFLLLSRLNELTGRNYKKCIRLKMKYLFVDEVLELYTWRGTEEKSSFKKLTAINALILRSVRDEFPNCKYDEFKDYMMQWLKHAKSRQRIVTYTYPDPDRKQKNFKRNRDDDESSYDEE